MSHPDAMTRTRLLSLADALVILWMLATFALIVVLWWLP